MQKSTDRILTTHAGSLVRTPEVIEAMMRSYIGRPIDRPSYEQILAKGVTEVVRRQADTGLDVIDDGEYGKSNWIAYLVERLEGLEPTRPTPEQQAAAPIYPDRERFGSFYQEHVRTEYTQWIPDTPSKEEYIKAGPGWNGAKCIGPIRYKPEALTRDIADFKAALKGVNIAEAFMPVAAPCSVEMTRNLHYTSQEDFLFAVADALKTEYRMIVDAGFILQVDDAILPAQTFMKFHGRNFDEYLAWARVRIDALNHALQGIPEDRVRYHVCFGSHNVPHISDPSLKSILDLVLSVKAQAYSLEASNPRHEHEWHVWEEVRLPEGKILIPGVVCHSTNIVEHPELISQRIVNFANLVGRENVIAGTDCGFSQGWNAVRVHPEVQWAKLEALVEGARIASKSLWSNTARRSA